MKKMSKFLFIIFVIFCLVPVFSVFAQTTSEDTPATGFRSILSADGDQGVSLRTCLDSGCCNLCDTFTVGSNIVKFLRNVIAFPVVVLMIIYGGIMMIFSGGSPKRVTTGKKSMTSALVGFGIVWGVSLILNSALMIITKSPASFSGFISGDLSMVGWSCEKDCGSGTTSTGKEDDYTKFPGVNWADGVSTAGVKACIMNAINDLMNEYGNGKVTVTSLNDGSSHSQDSYHYKGLAADIQVNGRRDPSGASWPPVIKFLESKGFYAFCDSGKVVNGKIVSVPCNEATHIHFDTRNMSNGMCPQ